MAILLSILLKYVEICFCKLLEDEHKEQFFEIKKWFCQPVIKIVFLTTNLCQSWANFVGSLLRCATSWKHCPAIVICPSDNYAVQLMSLMSPLQKDSELLAASKCLFINASLMRVKQKTCYIVGHWYIQT